MPMRAGPGQHDVEPLTRREAVRVPQSFEGLVRAYVQAALRPTRHEHLHAAGRRTGGRTAPWRNVDDELDVSIEDGRRPDQLQAGGGGVVGEVGAGTQRERV